MDPYALDIQANTKDMTERPITKDIEAKQPPPSSREDQERPREGRCQTERIPGRPAKGRLAGPTLQRLELIFAWKLRQPTLLRTTDASAKYRPLASINREPHPHSQHTPRSSLLSFLVSRVG